MRLLPQAGSAGRGPGPITAGACLKTLKYILKSEAGVPQPPTSGLVEDAGGGEVGVGIQVGLPIPAGGEVLEKVPPGAASRAIRASRGQARDHGGIITHHAGPRRHAAASPRCRPGGAAAGRAQCRWC